MFVLLATVHVKAHVSMHASVDSSGVFANSKCQTSMGEKAGDVNHLHKRLNSVLLYVIYFVKFI